MSNREIFDENIKSIYNAAKIYRSSKYDLDEWNQMCICRILQYLHCYDVAKGKFSTWVHKCIMHYRNYEDARLCHKMFKNNFEYWDCLAIS